MAASYPTPWGTWKAVLASLCLCIVLSDARTSVVSSKGRHNRRQSVDKADPQACRQDLRVGGNDLLQNTAVCKDIKRTEVRAAWIVGTLISAYFMHRISRTLLPLHFYDRPWTCPWT